MGAPDPTRRLALLRARADIEDDLRSSLRRRGYWFVQTPLLGVSPGGDRHIEAFETDFRPPGGAPVLRWLMTSPELPMKRLLAEGSGPIAQITRAFRNGEVSPRHNPEFTLAEWYRPGWTYRELMAEVEDVVDELAKRHGQRHPLPRPFPRVGVLEALARLGVGPDRVQDPATLRAACRSRALVPPEDADAETLYHFLLATAVEPALSPEGPAFLVDYPAFHASLARVRAGPWPVAERFELFLSGLEIANGFSELTDASEQRRRCEADTRARGAAGLKPYPLDEAFLAALETGLPECAGVAVGVDRLVMWLLDVPSIQDVLCYPYA